MPSIPSNHGMSVTVLILHVSVFVSYLGDRTVPPYDPTHCTLACLSTKSITRLFTCHGNLIALTVHGLQQLPSLTSLADTNYSRLKYSMLEQWRVSPSLVTHASVSMSRQQSRTKTAHVRMGGDLAKITTRCSAAGLGKVRSVSRCQDHNTPDNFQAIHCLQPYRCRQQIA